MNLRFWTWFRRKPTLPQMCVAGDILTGYVEAYLKRNDRLILVPDGAPHFYEPMQIEMPSLDCTLLDARYVERLNAAIESAIGAMTSHVGALSLGTKAVGRSPQVRPFVQITAPDGTPRMCTVMVL